MVVGGGPAMVSGMSRALDALIAAEETRRRALPGAAGDLDPHADRLSLALRASLPKLAAPVSTEAPRSDTDPELAKALPLLSPVPSRGRDWDEIRDLIEALSRAGHRSKDGEGREDKADPRAEIHPWRPARTA
ncbi:hypothetical protein LQ948_02550 [Jiella sp. MQZ9-1]|uniref:Uncharacterized protein n=1 Tax=Jiella flava TaxID=2816857 RepID=A0A939JSU1_9HYPH|nr:hypothetical protein [Jiella flava]MBO0661445.1 hypothetical protein [Jiella flava]MCD2470088.1 hypothetical protein [Jiella flava]